MIDLPAPHNPALPDERRRLATEVLRAGTALALDVPRAVAELAERDALRLSLLHCRPERLLGFPEQDTRGPENMGTGGGLPGAALQPLAG